MAVELTGVVPAEAVAYFAAKGYRLEESFAWADRWQEEHAAMFTVAKSTGFDILGDIQAAVEDAIARGGTLEQFKTRLIPVLVEKGWWGKAEMVDPLNGQPVTVQLGSPRRLKIIFDTNLRMAYSSGRWQRIQRVKATRPFIRYVAVMDGRTRPLHRAWHDTVLPVDDPWWQTHFPPNGWNCRCSVQSLNARDLKRYGLKLSKPPSVETRPFINRRSGEVVQVPKGIDPGFAYNPGQAAVAAHAGRLLADGFAGLPPALAARASAAAATFALPQIEAEFATWVKAIIAQIGGQAGRSDGTRRVIGAFSPAVLDDLQRRGIEPQSGAISISHQDVQHLLRDDKRADGKAIALADLLRLPTIIARPQAVLWDKRLGNLVYVFEPTGDARDGKLVVFVNFQGKLPPTAEEARRTFTTNAVRTAGLVDRARLIDRAQYELIAGEL